jgi:hypothetical protein
MRRNCRFSSRSAGTIRGPLLPTAMCPPAPSPFSLDDAAQSLAAGRAAKPPRRDQMRAREVLFAPGTIAAKKSGVRGWALALARPDTRCARRVRRRLQAVPNSLCSLALSAPGPILPVLGLAFLSTVDGLPIPLAGPSLPPASGLGPALRAAVSSLGTCGTKGLLTVFEQTQPLPRLTCPLTGSRLAASLVWASDAEIFASAPRRPTCLPPVPNLPSSLRSRGLASKPRGRAPINCKPTITA